MKRLHPATIFLQIVEFLRQFLFTIIVAVFASRRSENVGEIVAAGFGAFAILIGAARYYTMRYGIEDSALQIHSGLIWKQSRTIPLASIQNVFIKQTLLERIFGVVSLQVETASGSKAEGQLSALSRQDAELLRSQLLKEAPPLSAEAIAQDQAPSIFSVSIQDLMLAGALQNRAWVIIAWAGGLFQAGGISKTLTEGLKKASDAPDRSLLYTTVFVAGLFVVGWLFSVGTTVIKFGGFRLDRHEKGVRVRYGLINLFETILPIKRVQSVTIIQPFFFRFFNLYEVQAQSMGSFDKEMAGGHVHLAPVTQQRDVPRLVQIIFPNLNLSGFSWKPIHPFIKTQKFIRNLVWTSLFILPMAIFLKPIYLAAYAVLIPLWLVNIHFQYSRLGYSFDGEFIAVQRGYWRHRVEYMPTHHIQSVQISNSWFERRRGLAGVMVYSASSVVSIPLIPIPEAQALTDELTRLSYRAEGGV